MIVNINNEWKSLLNEEINKDYFKNLLKYLDDEYLKYNIFPDKDKIFRAYNLTDYSEVKVVILGQDPYYNKGQGNGLAFSVNEGVKLPPSLVNIYNEISSDLMIDISQSGDLSYLAKQGVFLLNTTLTVREKSPNSHLNIGWSKFTDRTIELINQKSNPVVFMLWGKNSCDKIKYITNKKHLILTAPHPSPLSAYRGFIGCKHFSKCNEFLVSCNIKPISWAKNS